MVAIEGFEPREHSAHMHMGGGGSVREIFWRPKNISSASQKPKNITYFYALTPANEHKHPKTMQIEARIASTQPRSISLIMFNLVPRAFCHERPRGRGWIMFYAQKIREKFLTDFNNLNFEYLNHNGHTSYFVPKNITFGNIQKQKYRTYLPMCTCS